MGNGVEAGSGPVEAMLGADRASSALGIELVEGGAGFATVRMRVTGDMLNGHGTAHGGHLFLLADTAFACACNSHGPVTVAAGARTSPSWRPHGRATSCWPSPGSAPATAAAASTT